MNWFIIEPRKSSQRTYRIDTINVTDKHSFPSTINVSVAVLKNELVKISSSRRKIPFTFLSNDVTEISDIKELDAGVDETNVAIELCTGAISANLTNIIAIVNIINTQLDSTSSTQSIDTKIQTVLLPALINGAILLVASFMVLIGITLILKFNKDSESRRRRLMAIWTSNLLGLSIMILSFFMLGRLL